MNAPLRKQLSREEYNKLTVEQQLSYMQDLLNEMRARAEETRRQLEEAKKTLASLEKKYPGST